LALFSQPTRDFGPKTGEIGFVWRIVAAGSARLDHDDTEGAENGADAFMPEALCARALIPVSQWFERSWRLSSRHSSLGSRVL
jgi:hypothetical protein